MILLLPLTMALDDFTGLLRPNDTTIVGSSLEVKVAGIGTVEWSVENVQGKA